MSKQQSDELDADEGNEIEMFSVRDFPANPTSQSAMQECTDHVPNLTVQIVQPDAQRRMKAHASKVLSHWGQDIVVSACASWMQERARFHSICLTRDSCAGQDVR